MNDLERMRQMAGALIDGTARPPDADRLSSLLRERPELRDAYLGYLDTHAALCWQFRDQAAAAAPAKPSPAPAGPRRPDAEAWLPWLLTGVAAAVALVALLWPRGPMRVAPPGTGADGPESTGSIAALLVDEAGAEFAAGRGPDGVRFGPGRYELLKGAVHLRFSQGADVVLAGPARLDVGGPQQIRLIDGKIRVIAPPTARGFTVATRDADFIDLGTEFGLSVQAGGGASDLYVFDGQVNVADPRSGKVLSEVLGGKSLRSVDGKLMTSTALKEGDFPTPGAIGLKRWEEHEQEMRKDRTLLAFFPFRRAGDESVLVNGAEQGAMADGRIVGSRWTTGRWPGKGALLLDGDMDHVQIDVPGEHRELTIAAWIKVERLDFVLNAILNSDGAEPGGMHFQLNRQGFPRGGVIVHGNFQDRVVGEPVPLGKWTHVASVLSARSRSQQIFVNGVLARERRWGIDQLARPGACRIGNWLADPKDRFPARAFRGQIDELAVWGRALPQNELKRLVDTGRPGLLWNEK